VQQRQQFERATEVIAAVALVAVAMIAFSPGLAGPYLWDDKALIPGNPWVREMNVRAWFTRDFWDVGGDVLKFDARLHYYRPLVTATYAIDFRLGGGDPFLPHLTNLLLHAGASVLALFTLRRWTGALLPAIAGVLFFALHPTKGESVAWISGRTDVLCTLAILVAALGAARRLRDERGGLLLELAGTLVAYLTKEGAVVLPAIVAVEAWIALGRPALDRGVVVRLVRAAFAQVAIAFAYLVTRQFVMPLRPTKPNVGLVDHAQLFLESVGRYVALSIAPVSLSSQHALLRTFNGRIVHSLAFVALGAVAIAALVGLAIALRRRAPVVTVALGLFAVLILPVSNLVLTGLLTKVAERFLYLPVLAVAWLLAEGVAQISVPRRRVALVVVALAFLPLAFHRSLDFSDELGFWKREAERHPESLDAQRVLLSRARDEHRYAEALEHALKGREQAATWSRHNGAELDFLHHYLELRAFTTPDRATARLEAIHSFFRAMNDPAATVAEIHLPDLDVTAPIGKPPFSARVPVLRPRTAALLADLASRLGRDEEARTLAAQARDLCRDCPRASVVSALIAARSGDYPGAYRLLDELARARGEETASVARKSISEAELARKQAAMASGPVALQLRATELSRLELYGRAYEVLAPYRAQIELAPGFALGFAELAYRAGEESIAREVLEKHVPAEKIAPMLDGWARKMGWVK